LNVDSLRRFRFAPILIATVLTVLILLLVRSVANVFVLVFIAILISLYLRGLAAVIERRTKMPEPLPFVAALTITIAAVVTLVSVLVPPVVQQTQQLYTVLPDYIAGWEAGLDRLAERYPALREAMGPGENRLVGALYDRATESVGGLVPRALGVAHVAINMVAVVVMAIYMSLSPALYRDWLIMLFPPAHRSFTREVLADLGHTLRSWIVGLIEAMIVLGALTAIGLYALDVPFWLPFGLFTGLAFIVPFFGTIVSTILPALFVLNGAGIGSFGPVGHSVLVLLLGTVIHVIEANLVAPLIMQNKVKLPPVLLLVSVLIMGQILGPLGLVVAVPTLAVVMVLVRKVLVGGIYEGGVRLTPTVPSVAVANTESGSQAS
jgi:predicted PurR-regulated permease PerM